MTLFACEREPLVKINFLPFNFAISFFSFKSFSKKSKFTL